MIDNSKEDKKRIRTCLRHHGTCLGAMFLAVPASAATPSIAWASSGSAYTEEKWASLCDNVLEYDESADLIHKYNVTVINNRIEYDEYRGKDHDGVENACQGMADKFYDSSNKMMGATDEDQPGYGSVAAGAISAQLQAEQNQGMADSQNEDGYVKKLEYDRQKVSLVKEAQVKMNSYWQEFKAMPTLEEAAAIALSQYQSAVVEAGQGVVIQAEFLFTQKKAETAQAAVQIDEKGMDVLCRELCVMIGWSYDAWPDIQETVVPDPGEVDSIDLAVDKKGVETTNYTQAASERRLKYTGIENQCDAVERKAESERRQVEVGVEAKYKLLKQAQADCDRTWEELGLAARSAQTVERHYSLGTIPRNEYLQQQGGLTSRQSSNDMVGLRFRQAMGNYQWTVNGLAQTEGA